MLLAIWRPRRRALWFLLVPVLPLLVVSGTTSYEYLAGTVRIPGTPPGLRSRREVHNLEPKYRVLGSSYYYKPLMPWAWLSAWTRLHTLAALVDCFGPVPGSYQGPYPDREQVLAAIRAARVLTTPEALTQPLLVAGRSIQLSAQDVRRMFETTPSVRTEGAVLTLALFEETCLLIGFSSGTLYQVEMLDTAGFGWFARYVFPSD
jgi:hypothetical protein